MRLAARFILLFLWLLAGVLLAGCSLAAPAPVGTARPLEQQPAAAQPQSAQPFQLPTRRPSAGAGAALYQEKCVDCHGAQGRGDGRFAGQLAQDGIQVADLTSDVAARARTPQQWYDIISNGRLEKRMPPFSGSLDPDQRWDVIAYAWSLAVSPQQVERGKEVYAEQCVQCHGDSGKGDGRDVKTQLLDLTDFASIAQVAPGIWDQAMASGHVPSFAGTVSEADRRAAIDYIRTFAYDYPSGALSPAATPSTSTGEQPPVQTPPTAPEQVTGYIVMGTPGQSLPPNLTVIFEYQRGSDGTIISQTVPLDAQGRFVVTETQLSHGDVMRARTEYDAITYFSEVVPVGLQATLPITLYERTTDASTVRANVLHVIAQPTDEGLGVSEVYVLSNGAERVIANPGQPVLHFSLPAGATQFAADPDMPADVLVPGGDGLDFFGSLAAASQGTQSIAFNYVLPKGSTVLDRVMSFPIDAVNLLVQGEPQAIRVSSDRFQSQGTRSFEGQIYQLFQASDLTPGETVALKIDASELGPGQTGSMGTEATGALLDWRIILGIGLIVVGAVGLLIWQRGQKKQPAVAHSQAIEKDALIDQIAALDDEFAEGRIDEINYKAKRAKLKDKLIKLMEEE